METTTISADLGSTLQFSYVGLKNSKKLKLLAKQ
jgi:hypothetical protein